MAIVEVAVCLLAREKQGREACLGRRAICKRDPSDCQFLVVRLGTGIIACPGAFVVTMGAICGSSDGLLFISRGFPHSNRRKVLAR